jgi:hypothetical protein
LPAHDGEADRQKRVAFYTAVTGKEPPPEVAAKIRASFEEPGAQSERKPDDAPTDDRGLIARREGRA